MVELSKEIIEALRARADADIAAATAEEERLRIAREATARVEAENARIIEYANLATKAAITTSLTPLLDVVNAREQLEQVQKVWTVGAIDQTPQVIPYHGAFVSDWPPHPITNGPFVGLALRYRFTDFKEEHDPGNPSDGIPSRYNFSVHPSEAALYVLVGEHSGLSFVTSLYGKRQLEKGHGDLGEYMDGRYYDRSEKTAEIFPNDPIKSRQVLRDQLFEISTNATLPLALEKQAREKTPKDLLPKPTPWYRRLL
jgi:hypothetical protein